MKVIKKTKHSELATVYIAESLSGQLLEFVESTQPPFSRDQKWVLVISTLFGCPVDCKFCDAGGNYKGKVGYDDLLFQIDYLIRNYYPDRSVTCNKFKIQFARMGEPSFNPAVLQLLSDLPGIYDMPGFIPSLSTIAPRGTNQFFTRLLQIKKKMYSSTFQLQFSIHSTRAAQRDRLIPVRKWDFHEIAAYGKQFFDPGGRKITLNFALSTVSIIDPKILIRYFDPDLFIIKLTPLNPTHKAARNKMQSLITTEQSDYKIIEQLNEKGYEVIKSIGEWEENLIGSNCGQYVQACLKELKKFPEAYLYELSSSTADDVMN
jgi:23S rRNA (adenine2503-C2)-methyltransferase